MVGSKSNKILIYVFVLVIIVAIILYYRYYGCNTTPGFQCTGFSSPFLGPPCVAISGYYCLNATYSHNNGNIIVWVGQNTRKMWYYANFVFVPQGTAINSSGIPIISFNAPTANIAYSLLSSGKVVNVYLPNTGSVNIGRSTMGTIWAQYTTQPTSNKTQYVQLAGLKLNAS